MLIHGVDFTSAPGRRKAICVASGRLVGRAFEVRALESLETWAQFEAWLARPGPWVAGFDFPFGLPREAVLDLGWPRQWNRLVEHCASLGRARMRAAFDAYRESRPAGNRYAHRRGDHAARSHSPLKLINPPVALMFLEGTPRLLAAGLELPGLQSGDPLRVGLEAYPGFAVRQLGAAIGPGARPPSYKNDARAKQTPQQCEVRAALVHHAMHIGLPGGVRLSATSSLRDALVEDASGDRLDAVLCAMQAAACWLDRDRNYGLPEQLDPLEGWIATVPASS